MNTDYIDFRNKITQIRKHRLHRYENLITQINFTGFICVIFLVICVIILSVTNFILVFEIITAVLVALADDFIIFGQIVFKAENIIHIIADIVLISEI